MFRRPARLALALAAGAALTAVPAAAHALPITEINDGRTVDPLVDASRILVHKTGYVYEAGKQNSHLTVRIVKKNGHDGVLYTDTGTKELRSYPKKKCRPQSVSKGVSIWCRVPARFTQSNPMFLEIWPRLGDDYVDGSSLPSMYRLWMLADKGNDTMIGGAGADFFNGAQDNDKVWGNGGNDWLRTGIGTDDIYGGDGNDKLVGADNADHIHGGAGNDGVYGAGGNDTLWGDSGQDNVVCSTGSDSAYVDSSDHTNACESVSRS